MKNQQIELTQKERWDKHWARVKLPVILDPNTKKPVGKEIIRIFEKFLPKKKLSAIEIGGAPGGFAAYLNKYFGYETSIIDYSEIGCEKTQQNFNVLGLNVKIYNRDFFGDLSGLPRFDVVFSFGFIEHFSNLNDVFKRHIVLLKKDGILILGTPNFRGLTENVLKHTAPKFLSSMNFEAMDLENWNVLENVYGLAPLFKEYVGGFEPKHLKKLDQRTLKTLSVRYFFKMIHYLMLPFPFVRKYNSPNWSAYLLGVYTLNQENEDEKETDIDISGDFVL